MNWLTNAELSTKLILAFVMGAVLAGILGGVAIIELRTLNSNYQEMFVEDGMSQGWIGKVAIDYQLWRVAQRDSIIEMLTTKDPQVVRQKMEECKKLEKDCDENMAVIPKTLSNEEEKEPYHQPAAGFSKSAGSQPKTGQSQKPRALNRLSTQVVNPKDAIPLHDDDDF